MARAVFVVLVLQLGLVMVLPAVHAQAEAAALSAILHVSDQGGHSCATHVDDLCQLCRSSVRTPKPPTRFEASFGGCDQRFTTRLFSADRIAQWHLFGALASRAPPA